MAQQGLTYAPSSRDDVVSALLNDYGTGFEEEVSTYSHISAQNESPITPAVQRMNTKFQLRGKPTLFFDTLEQRGGCYGFMCLPGFVSQTHLIATWLHITSALCFRATCHSISCSSACDTTC
jgi:hypothetical protein